MRTLEQIRAEFVWNQMKRYFEQLLNDARQSSRGDEGKALKQAKAAFEKYRNLAKSVPALVMTNGLMQTLAFLKGKADTRSRNEYGQLLNHVLEWLREASVIPGQHVGFEVAMNWCVARERTTLDYQRATEETQAILRWIRQLADTLQ